jgi:NADH-quinone oxidoreductase subunit C
VTTAVTGNELAELLGKRFPDAIEGVDDTAVWIASDRILDVCAFLQGDSQHDFALLSSITAVDYVDQFAVVYRLTSISRNASTVLKVCLYGRENLALQSVTSIWQGANLQEREVFDLLGVSFEGHPNLKRLLTWEGFEGHPLRRDYLEPPLPYTWPQGG